MNIRKYALKSFRYSSGKGVLFIVALSAMLICAVLNIATSLQRTMFNEAVAMAGDAHAKYMKVTPEQTELLDSCEEVEWTDQYLNLRTVWGSFKEDRHSIIELIHSTRMGEMAGFTLVKGHAPSGKNEVALAPHTADLLGIQAKVGTEFSMLLTHIDGKKEWVDFVVSGVMQEQSYHKAMGNYILYVSEEFAYQYGTFKEDSGDVDSTVHGDNRAIYDVRDVFVQFRSGHHPESTAYRLAELVGINQKDVGLNWQYINANLQDPMTILIVAVIVMILLLAGALVIYNAFHIMIVKRTHQFGLLTLIGASKKQIRGCIYWEALLSTVLALPAGLLLGTAFSYFGLPLARNIIANAQAVYYITPWTYALTVILTVVMVFVGVTRPAYRASKVVPVEAVRFTGAVERHYRRREEKNISLPVLAKLNMKRNRGRTISTILSLSISGILFLGISTVGFSLLSSVGNLTRHMVAGDIQVLAEYGSRMTEEVIGSFRDIEGIKQIQTFLGQGYCTGFTEDEGMLYPDESGMITGIEKDTLLEVLELVYEGNPKAEDLLDPMNVLAVNWDNEYAREYNFQLGQIVTVYLRDENGFATETSINVRVVGLIHSDDFPPYIQRVGNLPELIMPQSLFPSHGLNLDYQSITLDIDEQRQNNVSEIVSGLCQQEGNIYFKSYRLITQEFEGMIISIITLIMMILVIIALVGILNLISTTFIGIEQRQKEFGVLLAMGLSNKGLRKILTWEGIRVSCISVLISIVFGLGIGYGLYQAMVQAGADYMVFHFPLIPSLVLFLVYGLVPYIIMRIALKRLSKSAVMELVRHEI